MEPTPTTAAAATVDKAQSLAGRMLEYCTKLLTEYGFRLLGAIVVLIIAYFVAGWTKRAVNAALERARFDVTISKFVSNIARYAVIVLALMSCAPIMGINITAFAAVRSTLLRACASCPTVLKDPAPAALLSDMAEGGLKWSITVWSETPTLPAARDQAITAVRDALARDGIKGPSPVTTIRLLDRPA